MTYRPNLRVSGPDLSGLGTVIIDYDPMYEGVETVSELHTLSGGVGYTSYRIFDRSGLQNHATTTPVIDSALNIPTIDLAPAGKRNRVGYRFGGAGAFMPPAAFAALNEVEVWAVIQAFTTGNGFHAIGASANAGTKTEYVDGSDVWKDDALATTLASSAALTLPLEDIHLVQIKSTGALRSMWFDGTAVATNVAGVLETPLEPVIGAGRVDTGVEWAIFDGVILRYVVFSAIVTNNARAAGVAAVQGFYGTP